MKDGSSNEALDDTLNKYFYKWRLKPNPSKIEVCVFHLKNRQEYEEIDVVLNGVHVHYSFKPMY